MHINMDDLINSFEIMGKGMLSIFVVIILITLIVTLMAKLGSRPDKK